MCCSARLPGNPSHSATGDAARQCCREHAESVRGELDDGGYQHRGLRRGPGRFLRRRMVQASHQVVVISIGDHSHPDVAGQRPQRVRHLGEDHRRRVHVRVRSGELPGRRLAAKWREQPPARRQPRLPVRDEPASGIPGRIAADHLDVAAVELTGTQRQAQPPGEVVEPARSDRLTEVDQRAVEVQQHRADGWHTTSMASDGEALCRPVSGPPGVTGATVDRTRSPTAIRLTIKATSVAQLGWQNQLMAQARWQWLRFIDTGHLDTWSIRASHSNFGLPGSLTDFTSDPLVSDLDRPSCHP